MRRHLVILLPLFLFLPLQAQNVEEIVRKAEDQIRGKTSHAIIEMKVVTPDYTRTLKMESWWVGTEKALIVIKAPRKEAGNKTLKIKNEIWNFLRNTETIIKIPPSMLMQSWNGSDFTNDDLVRESSLSRDYFMELLGEEEIEGALCWKIKLTPKPDAPVVWGKLIYWVRQSDNLPARVEYYDERDRLVRHMVFSDFRVMHGRKIPTRWVMVNDRKPGRYTEIRILDIQFDIRIPDRIFSFRELERGG
ncbi:MAG: outer membrane lipoprotein-sorting protein [Calditrichaeota bacterium]|nr:outer membrane lipoprotein-sorting protein [Calditrichota bacterium]